MKKEDILNSLKILEKEVREAYTFLREKNHTIPSDTLEFMLYTSIRAIDEQRKRL